MIQKNYIESIHFTQLSRKFNPVLFQSKNKIKNIKISINSDLKIRVIYPDKLKIDIAKNFFESKIIWAQNSLIKLSKRKEIRKNNIRSLLKNSDKESFLSKNQYLLKRCKELANTYGFKVNKVSLRRQKTIWGSCSSANNISLNSNLIFLSKDLVDYVILHELVHTKIKNHSYKFWDALIIVLPNALALDKELKKYSPNFINELSENL